jgi:hypothetical protein
MTPTDTIYTGPRSADPVPGPTKALAVQTNTIRWGAIFAGVFVALLTYSILMSLGMAIGGGSAIDVVRGEDGAQGLGIGAAIWTVLSALISLYLGGHVAGRVGGLIPTRVGSIQGLVVAGIFFAVMASQVGAVVGAAGRGLGGMAGAMGDVVSQAGESPVVEDIIGNALSDLNLRAPPEEVVRGVAARLIRGNEEGAMNYLARQAGIPPEEARQRLDSVRAQVQAALQDAGVAAARAVRTAGWTLFGALFLGTIFAMLGGSVGAQLNLRHPISASDRKALRDQDYAA